MRFGYTIIFVEDVERTVEFYERAFGLSRRNVTPLFAQMETAGVTLAFGANRNERQELPISFRENTLESASERRARVDCQPPTVLTSEMALPGRAVAAAKCTLGSVAAS